MSVGLLSHAASPTDRRIEAEQPRARAICSTQCKYAPEHAECVMNVCTWPCDLRLVVLARKYVDSSGGLIPMLGFVGTKITAVFSCCEWLCLQTVLFYCWFCMLCHSLFHFWLATHYISVIKSCIKKYLYKVIKLGIICSLKFKNI